MSPTLTGSIKKNLIISESIVSWKTALNNNALKIHTLLDSKMSDGSLLSIVDNSLAISHVLRQLNLPLSGRNTKLVRDYLNLHEVDLSHFTPNGLPPAKLYSKICPVCSVEFFHLLNKEQTTCSIKDVQIPILNQVKIIPTGELA